MTEGVSLSGNVKGHHKPVDERLRVSHMDETAAGTNTLLLRPKRYVYTFNRAIAVGLLVVRFDLYREHEC